MLILIYQYGGLTIKNLSIFFIVSFIFAHANSLEWITATVNDMKERRVGMEKELKISDPFIYNIKSSPKEINKVAKKAPKANVTVKQKIKKAPLKLQAILNERAKISGHWYKQGSHVRGLELYGFAKHEVILRGSGYKKHLKLFKKNKNILISRH